jgi:hypothetical protein
MLSRCHAIISVSWRRRGWDGQYGKALAELSVFGPGHNEVMFTSVTLDEATEWE